MIGFLIEDISKDDFIKILKSVVFIIYRKTDLTREIIDFIQKIASYANLNESDLQNIFMIDTRYHLDFKDVIASMELKSSKVMLIILVLFSELFEEIDLSKTYKKMKFFDHIPMDDDYIDEIIKHTKDYLKITKKIYDDVYLDKSLKEKIFSKDEESIKKFFLLDMDKIRELSKEDKENFLKILRYLMLEDNYLSDIEKDVLFIWENLFELDKDIVEKDKNIDIKSLPTLQSTWLKRFLVFSFLVSQHESKKKLNIVKNISKFLDIPKDTLDDIIKLSHQYQEKIKILITYINSPILSSPDEEFAKNIKITLNITETILFLIPSGGLVRTLLKSKTIARGIANLHRQSYIDELGIVDVITKNSDELIICIDGFLSEMQEKQFEDWKSSLIEFGVQSDIKGFQWGAENLKTFSSAMIVAWYGAVEKTKNEALELVFEIEKLSKKYKNISLMGHSLGARVIYHTINPLLKMNIKLKNIYLFGGAVSSNKDEAKTIWYNAMCIVKENLYNFYSHHDEVLKRSYKTAMVWDTPVGLESIKPYITKGVQIEKLKNIDVSDIIKGHTEYKPKLAQILKTKEIIL